MIVPDTRTSVCGICNRSRGSGGSETSGSWYMQQCHMIAGRNNVEACDARWTGVESLSEDKLSLLLTGNRGGCQVSDKELF